MPDDIPVFRRINAMIPQSLYLRLKEAEKMDEYFDSFVTHAIAEKLDREAGEK